MNEHRDVQYSRSCVDWSEKDVSIFEVVEVKAECQYVVFPIYAAVWGNLLHFFPVEGNW